jgi:hypothetical protein
VESVSLLKNTLYARFGPRSGPKHTVFGAFWSFRSLIRSYCALSADFFNRLTHTRTLVNKGEKGVHGQQLCENVQGESPAAVAEPSLKLKII